MADIKKIRPKTKRDMPGIVRANFPYTSDTLIKKGVLTKLAPFHLVQNQNWPYVAEYKIFEQRIEDNPFGDFTEYRSDVKYFKNKQAAVDFLESAGILTAEGEFTPSGCGGWLNFFRTEVSDKIVTDQLFKWTSMPT